MVDFIDRIGNATASVCMELIDMGVNVKKGCLVVLEQGSRVMYDIYSLEGFEKWDKALIANLKFLSLLPSIKGVFDESLKTFDGLKDLYYGTMFVGSMADFIHVNRTTGKKSFQLPRLRDGSVDLVKILYAIGNGFETGKFFQKYSIYAFPRCTQLANYLGSVKIFQTPVNDIPVVCALTDRPKDFFIFIAAGIELYRCVKKPLLEWENALKITGSVGKLCLIYLSRHHSKQWWFVAIDVVTQNASLAAFILKRHRDRERNFYHPGAAPAA